MVLEQRTIRRISDGAASSCTGDAILQRPGRFVNAPHGLAPASPPPPDDTTSRDKREAGPIRLPQPVDPQHN